ncbi:MAG: TolC family protein [Phycisphaerae bacterium]
MPTRPRLIPRFQTTAARACRPCARSRDGGVRAFFFGGFLLVVAVGGCVRPAPAPEKRPDIAPAARSVSADALALDASAVKPMYRELVPIDLYTVLRVVSAENIDIRLARYQVEQSRGQYERTVGGVFPVLAPTALFEHLDGSVRATEGNIVNVGFNTFQPSIAVQWVINPGKVVYEIIAAKKRLRASEHRADATRLETLRTAAVQFYELVLAQARISAADQAVAEAEELLRINKLRARTGAGVPADELRAEARLSERKQELAIALNALYKASLALAVTLQLDDPTVTLVPRLEELPPMQLVREDIPIEDLLAYAVAYRPDLRALRVLALASKADRGATWWGGFGPQFGASYQYSGITGHANNTDKGRGVPPNLIVNPLSGMGVFSGNPVANAAIRQGLLRGSQRLDHNRDETFSFSDQHRANVSLGARWSLSAFGDLKSARAVEKQAVLAAKQTLNRVRAQVIAAAQDSRTNKKLIGLAKQQMVSADEALRLTQANMQAGAMTTVDVLQAQDAVARARLRYAEAVVRYNQAEVNLVAALGLLDQAAVARAGGSS